MDEPEDDLAFIRREGLTSQSYLLNHSDETLKRIRVADKCIDAETGFVSSSPLYEIEDLPPRSYLPLPLSSGGYLLDSTGKQFWEVKCAEWTDGRRVEEIFYPEAKRLCGAEYSETYVEREVRRLGTIPSHHLGEEPGELSTPGKRHTQKLEVYRDTDWTLYLINGADPGAERLQLRCYHYRREGWRWPDKSDAEAKMVQICDVPPGAYVTLVKGFDSGEERFEFEAIRADWSDGETYEGPLELSLTNPARSTPLDERDLSHVGRDVEQIKT